MFLMTYGYNPATPNPIEPVNEDHRAVESISPSLAVFNNTAAQLASQWSSNRAFHSQSSPAKRVRDYLKTVKKRAQSTNQMFINQHLPYRLTVDLIGIDDIMIDLSILDKNGKVVRHSKRNVTHENFGRLMEDVSTGKGLLIDSMPSNA
jgi:hypothetical protein